MISERTEKLKTAKEVLKTEFVGLDHIIDRILECVAPWYLTPEIVERPVVVSLWGLTGTGKTSLVRRLLNLLELTGKSMFFDCGEQAGGFGDGLFSDKLDGLFDSSSTAGENDYRYTKEEMEKFELDFKKEALDKTDPLDYTFVFDEFQYLKTKDEDEKEIDRPGGRAIWNLIDSGLIDINQSSHMLNRLLDYLVDMEQFLYRAPNTKIKDGRFDPELRDILSSTIMYYRWGEPEEDEEGEKKGFKIIETEDLNFLSRRLNMIKKGLGFSFSEKIKTFTDLKSYLTYIKEYIDLVAKPKIINCSKSLIFVLGNLDEAFGLTGEDMDPDIDADVYHDMTSKVNIMDIKKALRKRFRDEQIGRLGNNLIIYPSLRRCDFEAVIEKELNRIADKFYKASGIRIEYGEKMKKFIYDEGVYPIQGVRPIYTTINSIITPRLSEVLVSREPETNRVVLDIVSERTDSEEVESIIYQFKNNKELRLDKKMIKTTLGSLRDPARCEKLAIQGVHEASHAVVYSLLTGEFPSAIIAGCITGGGYMMKEIDKDLSVESSEEFKNNVLISLAGYIGERHFFDIEKCTLGASNDFSLVWDAVSGAFARCGYDDNHPFNYSYGTATEQNAYLPMGLDWSEIEGNVKSFMINSIKETKNLIFDEEKLILEIAKYLSVNRCMSINLYKTYVEKYAKTFNLEKMEEIKKNKKDYYIRTLYDWDNGTN